MKKTYSKILYAIFFLALFGGSGNVSAATINAATCSNSDVSSAIASAAAGDTVQVPVGNCVWTSKIVIDKDIVLQGAGIDSTNITWNASDADGMIYVFGTLPDPVNYLRITGFTFKQGALSGSNEGIVKIGRGNGFRIDHCRFTDDLNRLTAVTTYVNGLIDNNTFEHTSAGICEILHLFYSATLGTNVDSWNNQSDIDGSSGAIFVEDNTFYNSGETRSVDLSIQHYNGVRSVIRHNLFRNFYIDAHGYSGQQRGTRHYDIYENTLQVDSGFSLPFGMNLRGGTGYIHDNTYLINGSMGGAGIALTDFGCVGTSGSPCCCGYPALDQIGRGVTTGAVLLNTNCTSPRGWSQALEPLYIHNNPRNGVDINPAVSSGTGCLAVCGETQLISNFIQTNRDYYANTEMPGYVSYIYPHPLRNEGVADIISPAAPSGLSVI